MKIAIEIHGTIKDGLWTAERGESRWAQNVAAVLAANGHEVDAFGSFAGGVDPWGACPKIGNVHFKQWREVQGQRYDAMFDTAWWLGKPLCPVADIVVIGSFWFHREVWNTALMAMDPRYRLVLPYAHNWAEFDVPENPHRTTMKLLPYTLPSSSWWTRASSVKATHHAPRLFWGNKAAFGEIDRWADIYHPFNAWAGLMLGEVEAAALVDVPTSMFGAEFLKPEFSAPAKHYHALARAQAAKGMDLRQTEPLGNVLAAMRRSTVCLNLPWAGSVPLEAVFEGCCPLAWRGAFIPVLAEVCERVVPDLVLDANTPDAVKLCRTVRALLYDDKLRSTLLAAYRQALEYLSPERFMSYWEAVVRS